MDSRSETQVKIDYAGTVLDVLNLKGHKIAQLALRLVPFASLIYIFGHFV